MKKYIIFLICFFCFVSGIVSVGAVNLPSSNKYTATAESSIRKYVTSLEAKKYSTSKIETLLKRQKLLYLKKKQTRLYKGDYKLKTDALLAAIDSSLLSLPQKSITPVSTPEASVELPPSTSSGKYVQKISTEFIKGNLAVNFHMLSGAIAKDYDVYTFIPSNNLILNNQPDPSVFIPGDGQIEKNSYNAYTFTTKFLTETEDARVASIRKRIESGAYTQSGSISLSREVPQIYTLLTDGEFFSRAIMNPRTYISNYTTYMIFIAKDGSEAFLLQFSQEGTKVRIGDLEIDSITQKSGTYDPTIAFRPISTTYTVYDTYIFDPAPGSDITETYRRIGMNTDIFSKFTESFAWGEKGLKHFSIEGYTITFDRSKNLQSFFTATGAEINLQGTPLTLNILDKKSLISKRQSDLALHRFILIVSRDKSQSYLLEMTQFLGSDE